MPVPASASDERGISGQAERGMVHDPALTRAARRHCAVSSGRVKREMWADGGVEIRRRLRSLAPRDWYRIMRKLVSRLIIVENYGVNRIPVAVPR